MSGLMQISLGERLRYGLLALVLLGLIFMYVYEFRFFDRLLEARRLVLWALTIGGILGFSIGFRLSRKINDLTERIQMMVFFAVLLLFFAPLFSSLLNRMFPIWGSTNQPVQLEAVNPYYSNRFGLIENNPPPPPTGYFVFLYLDNELHRFKTTANPFPSQLKGDTVRLTIKTGLWGFEFVELPEKR